MGYKDLVKSVQSNSGFSDNESKMALDLMVETIAERLEKDERQDFANKLPNQLQEIALMVEEPLTNGKDKDIIGEFMEREDIEEEQAKIQVMTAWEALKTFISERQISKIMSRMSPDISDLLY